MGPFRAVAQLTQNERHGEGLMSEYAAWVLARIAALIPRLQTPAERRSFWEPLFSPGEVARDLVASFLREWFYSGPLAAETPDHFVRCWVEILHYATSENNGSVGDVEWKSLMGLYWQGPAEYRPAVGRLLPFYQNWAEEHLTDGQTAKQICPLPGNTRGFRSRSFRNRLAGCGTPLLSRQSRKLTGRGDCRPSPRSLEKDCIESDFEKSAPGTPRLGRPARDPGGLGPPRGGSKVKEGTPRHCRIQP